MNTYSYSINKNIKTKLFQALTLVTISVCIFSVSTLEALATSHNSSLNFDVSGATYASISDATQKGLDITGDMTIAMWVMPSTIIGNMALVSKWSKADKTSYILFLEDGLLGVHLNDAPNGYGYSRLFAPHGKSANEWFHVAMVFSTASNTVELFVDGVSIGLSYDVPPSISNTDADFVIGGREDLIAPFVGKIKDVRIWSRALSRNMINDLFQNPNSFKNGELLQGYWKFNGNLHDKSGNKNNLQF